MAIFERDKLPAVANVEQVCPTFTANTFGNLTKAHDRIVLRV